MHPRLDAPIGPGRLVIALLLSAIVVSTLTPAPAEARTVKCRIGYFSPGLDDARFPTIHKLRAVDLPRLTDGYAPRCLVAESVAGLVKDRVARAARRQGVDFRFDQHAPKRVTPMGARWSGGSYRVRYRLLKCDCDPYVQVTATRGHKRVRFQIGTV
jgi:hypothetical protein